tara:strand:- start:2539 stop:2739 length:201 start_codon:yes stop_codon:yes gene_type:complete
VETAASLVSNVSPESVSLVAKRVSTIVVDFVSTSTQTATIAVNAKRNVPLVRSVAPVSVMFHAKTA